MSTTNLQMLQDACMAVNIGYPSGLVGLSRPQDALLRMLDESHKRICGMADGYFMQNWSYFTTVPYASGSAAQVTGSGPYTVAGLTASTLVSGKSLNGKMTIEDFSAKGKDKDVVRIDYASGTSGTILSPWDRGAHAGTDLDWVYGQDEYILPSDVERVSWVLCTRNGTSERHLFLEPVPVETLERIRANRSAYILNAQPNFYCVMRHGDGSFPQNYARTLVLDPFPYKCTVIYGYMKKPAIIYNSSTVYADVPDKWIQGVIDGALASYYSTLGMGAEAGAAGQDNPQRLVEVQQSYQEIRQEMLAEARIGKETFKVDPESATRMFYRDELGRNF